jgi:hypothetical protein
MPDYPAAAVRRGAVLRLMRIVRPVRYGSAEYWDQRTSGNDARTALSLACGGTPDSVDQVDGTWDGDL